jgi:hypothetical protein
LGVEVAVVQQAQQWEPLAAMAALVAVEAVLVKTELALAEVVTEQCLFGLGKFFKAKHRIEHENCGLRHQ